MKRIGAYRGLLGKAEGQRQLEKFRCMWEANIKMDLQEVGCGAWNGFMWIRIRTGGEHFKGVNEASGSIK